MADMSPILLLCFWLRVFLVSRCALAAENLALRQQLAILRRSVRRPRLRPCDRLFWVWLSRCWAGWKDALLDRQPGPRRRLASAGVPPVVALDDNAPFPRVVELPERGRVVGVPQVGGLHHRYTRVA
jgi:hypothetical protein